MSAPIATTEPASIVPGDTVKWTKSLPDYPASAGWDLSYELVNSSNRITFSSTASGDLFTVTISATDSESYAAGLYAWRARVSHAGEVVTVATGSLTIQAAFDAVIDTRSAARRTLDAIEATLEGRATSATASYQIAGRQLAYIPIPELLTLRDRYRMDVAREDAAQSSASGLPNPGRIQVRHI